MKEYIERAPLLERLSKVKMDEHGFGMAVQFGIDHAINCIKEAPAADVTEVRHGRWIPEACASVSKMTAASVLINAINHPDRIIRKPRFTEQEVEDAKAIKRLHGYCKIVRNKGTKSLVIQSEKGCGDISISYNLFPSIYPGQSYTLDEIIRGGE